MSVSNFDNVRILNSGVLKFRSANDLSVSSNADHQMLFSAANTAGKLALQAGTGGIVLDATIGNGTSGSTAGPINLTAQANSAWIVNNANLTLSTQNAGNVNITSSGASNYQVNGGDLSVGTSSGHAISLVSGSNTLIDATSGSINIGQTSASGVNLGRIGQNVAVAGNLHVSSAGLEAKGTGGLLNIGQNSLNDVVIGNNNNVNINGNLHAKSIGAQDGGSFSLAPNSTNLTIGGANGATVNGILMAPAIISNEIDGDASGLTVGGGKTSSLILGNISNTTSVAGKLHANNIDSVFGPFNIGGQTNDNTNVGQQGYNVNILGNLIVPVLETTNIDIDAEIDIGTDKATSVVIGRVGHHVNVNGDLLTKSIDAPIGQNFSLAPSASSVTLGGVNGVSVPGTLTGGLIRTNDLDSVTGNINIGATNATSLILGKSGVSSVAAGGLLTSTVDASSEHLLIGTSSATGVDIGKSGSFIRIKGNLCSQNLDSLSTLNIGANTNNEINIGQAGQNVNIIGNLISNGIDTASSFNMGTSVAQEVFIGRTNHNVNVVGDLKVNKIDYAGELDIGTSLSTSIHLGHDNEGVYVDGKLYSRGIDSTTGSLEIGSHTNGPVSIGSAGQTVTIAGNLVVSGTSTTIDSTIIKSDPLILLNSGPKGTPNGDNHDSGILIDRTASDVINDLPEFSGHITQSTTSKSVSGKFVRLAETDVGDYAGYYYIKLTSGPFQNQYRLIEKFGAPDAQVQDDWTPVVLTGRDFKISNNTLFGNDSIFRSELSIGSGIVVNSKYYLITNVESDNTASVIFSPREGEEGDGNDNGDVSANIVMPGADITYSMYGRDIVGMIWEAANDNFAFMSTTYNPEFGTVAINHYLDVKMNNLNANAIKLTGTDAAVWDDKSAFSSGELLLDGGIGTKSNIMAHSDGAAIGGPVLSLSQSNTVGAQPLAYLNQADQTQSFFSFEGTSADLTGVTNTIVNAASNSNLSTYLQAFVKISLKDNGTKNAVANGSYYIPLYSIVE